MNHNVPQAIEEGCCNGSPLRQGAPHAARHVRVRRTGLLQRFPAAQGRGETRFRPP